jgi:methyl-accepting chemotaxis protein
MKDPNGLALFKAFVATVRKAGKGFVAYQWPKPGSEQAGGQGLLREGLRALGLGHRLGHLHRRPARGAAAQMAAWTAGIVARRCCWRATSS